ncbi:hypothetical protein HYV81_03730 [Candidatus Woesearchaeota archaeon]|nr:hypothetical protein [Candidatus Woesearchaeota archaeon]
MQFFRNLRNRIDAKVPMNWVALKHLVTVVTLSSIANLFTVGFYVIMSRKLGPAEYSILAVLLAIFQVAAVVAGVVSNIIIKYITYFKAKSQYDKISTLLSASMRYLMAFGFLIFLLLTLFSADIAEFFRIPSALSVILLGMFIWSFLFISALLSAINGLQWYITLGLNRIFDALATLLLGILLVYLFALGVKGALVAMVLGALATIPFCLWSLRTILSIKKTRLGNIGLSQYILLAAAASVCIGILLNLDVILVKYFFKEVESGFYGALSLIGTVVFFISGALNTIIFPKVSESHSNGEDTSEYLRFGMLWTAVGCIIVITAYFLFPDFIVLVMLGSEYDIAGYIGIYAIAMSLLALSNILVVYNLAIKRWSILYVVVPAVFLELLLIYLFHQTLLHVVIVVLLFHVILFAALAVLCRGQLEDMWHARSGYKKFPASVLFKLHKE